MSFSALSVSDQGGVIAARYCTVACDYATALVEADRIGDGKIRDAIKNLIGLIADIAAAGPMLKGLFDMIMSWLAPVAPASVDTQSLASGFLCLVGKTEQLRAIYTNALDCASCFKAA